MAMIGTRISPTGTRRWEWRHLIKLVRQHGGLGCLRAVLMMRRDIQDLGAFGALL